MKKIITFTLSIFLVLMTSCDDRDEVPEVLESDFFGSWILTSAKTERLMDYNYDGQINEDLTDDLICFTLEFIFNNDSTFTEVRIDKSNVNNLSCIQINLNGTWLINQNKIIMTYDNQNFDNQENDVEFLNDRRFVIKRIYNDVNGNFLADLRMSRL